MTVNVGTTTPASVISSQNDGKDKKKSGNGSNGGNVGRAKDKKKENHATPMETSDEEAPHPMEIIGK